MHQFQTILTLNFSFEGFAGENGHKNRRENRRNEKSRLLTGLEKEHLLILVEFESS